MKDYTIYVTEEIAKKAMEKGFECSYDNDDYTPHFRVGNVNKGFIYILPTAEQICGWLEEVFHILPISILCYLGNKICWSPQIMRVLYDGEDEFESINDELDKLEFQTRNEALLEGINKALDLI